MLFVNVFVECDNLIAFIVMILGVKDEVRGSLVQFENYYKLMNIGRVK